MGIVKNESNFGLVSIIMPSYNTSKFIGKSIESIISQTYQYWELIIIDDCSTDNSNEVILSYKDDRIKIIKNFKNSGAAISRNNGIKKARGRWIAFLDSDDSWTPDKLERQIKFMLDNDVYFSATAYELFDENGTSYDKISIPPKKVDYNKFIMLACPIGNLTGMYDAEKLGKIYVPEIKKRNDFALWLQVLKKTEYCYGINENLARYTFGRKGSLSKNKFGLVKYHWELYRKIEKHSFIRSVFELLSWVFVKFTGFGTNTVSSDEYYRRK